MLNLKQIRQKKEYSVSKLSRLSGVSRPYITQLENDIYNNPTVEVICKLCRALEVSPNDIIKHEYWE